MDNLNPEIIGRLQLPMPSTTEQEEILEYVEKISERYDDLKCDACKQVELLQERRSALISAAVTGKIDVRNWQPPASVSVESQPRLEVAHG